MSLIDQAQWLPISTKPESEDFSYLVLTEAKVIVQVSNFEGQMYPDGRGFCVAFDDKITTPIGWMPIPDFKKDLIL